MYRNATTGRTKHGLRQQATEIWAEVTIALASTGKQSTEAVVMMASLCDSHASILLATGHQLSTFYPVSKWYQTFLCNFTTVYNIYTNVK